MNDVSTHSLDEQCDLDQMSGLNNLDAPFLRNKLSGQ
jgi:hypothetical protein